MNAIPAAAGAARSADHAVRDLGLAGWGRKEIAIAEKEEERATAQAQVLTAEAERERAKQQIVTVEIVRPAIPASVVALVTRKQSNDKAAQMGDVLIDRFPVA